MNKIIIMGRLSADPELKKTQSGLSVTNFTIATDRKGATEKATDWIDCVAWRKTAEFICKYFQKGSPIVLDGNLQTRTWADNDGKKHKVTEVIVDAVEFVPKTHGEAPISEGSVASEAPNSSFEEVEDEDLPF